MRDRFDPRLDVLPIAQKELWPALSPAKSLGFVLYGGTAIALQLGHRQSIDFDFFSSAPLDKGQLWATLPYLEGVPILDEALNSLVLSVRMPSGPVKLSFFGHIRFGHINEPLTTADGTLRCATLRDLMGTKLKTILDRAEAKDYRDIAALLAAGLDLSDGLAVAKAMFGAEPRTMLMAIGYFEDGDVGTISSSEKQRLLDARDRVRDIPEVRLLPGLFSTP